jgi:putative inorganic carbon (HCO3(-)) transporter
VGFLLLLLYLTLTYLRPWDFFPGLAAYRPAFWVGNSALAMAGLEFVAGGQYSLLAAPAFCFLLGFFAILVASPVTATGWLGGVILALTQSMVPLVSCLLILLTVRTLARMRRLAALICLLSLILVGLCVLAYHGIFATEMLVFVQRTEADILTGERGQLGRIRGLGQFNDPNDLAQALLAATPLLWPVWRAGRRLRNFLLVVLPSLVLLSGIYLTRSRGAILSILVVVVLRLRERMTRFRVAGPVMAAGCLGLLMLTAGFTGGRDISSSDASSEGRLDAWYDGMQMLLHNPVFGVGYGRFIDHHIRVAHNSFVHCFAELGLLGYFFWIGLLVAVHTDLYELGRSSGEDDEEPSSLAAWATAVRFSLYAFLAGAFFLSRTYSITLYMIIGLAIALGEIGRRTGQITVNWRSILTRAAVGTFASVVGIYFFLKVAKLVS